MTVAVAARETATARRIRWIRKTLGYTQRDFGYQLRVAINTISAWENGKAKPSPLADRAIRDLCAQEGLDLHSMRPFATGRDR